MKLNGYIKWKCCKVVYDTETDEAQAVETKNIFVNFLWWLIELFNLFDGAICFEQEEWNKLN